MKCNFCDKEIKVDDCDDNGNIHLFNNRQTCSKCFIKEYLKSIDKNKKLEYNNKR